MGILISDFDGTVTRYDFFARVRKRWRFAPQDDPWEKFVAGEITHFQALADIFVCIRTTEADLLELADSTEFDASFSKSARALQDLGWEILIASPAAIGILNICLRKPVSRFRSTLTREPSMLNGAWKCRFPSVRPSSVLRKE